MVTHEVPGDSFWDLIYSSDPEAPNQANLVQSAIDSKVAGIAVTLAKPDAMAPAVAAAQAAGIPVVAFNSGFDNFAQQGISQYFGQDEKLAGVAAGQRLTQDGARKALCVIQEQGQVAPESRRAGVQPTLTGPSFIDQSNIDSIAEYAQAGTR